MGVFVGNSSSSFVIGSIAFYVQKWIRFNTTSLRSTSTSVRLTLSMPSRSKCRTYLSSLIIIWLMYPGTRGAEWVFNNVIKAVPFFRFDDRNRFEKAGAEIADAVKDAVDSEDD